MTLAEAFWRYVEKTSTCWNWKASIGNHGYGQLTFQQKKYTAHRLSWMLHFGHPGALCVLHRCDNRRCVNPDHLFLGTRKENLEDMTQKGRRVKGESHGMKRLTEAQVREILASPETSHSLADRFSVSDSAIYLIRRRQRWAHLEGVSP